MTNNLVIQQEIPSWVLPISAPQGIPADPSQVNLQWLLIDRQIHVHEQSSYIHQVAQILAPGGAEEIANFSLGFDPDYERMHLHSFAVIREGERIEKLEPDKVKLLQRERGLERGIYDGSLFATFFLEDIREGDVLDYSYTLIGSNPILEGRFTASFSLQYTPKVEKLYQRFLLPSDRSFSIKHKNQEWASHFDQKEGEWIWHVEPSPAYQAEPDQPYEYSTRGSAEISEFQTWGEVARWGAKHYPVQESLRKDPKAAILVEEWKSAATPEERALKALRFVQKDIRYLGFEMGVQGIKPAAPLEVFKRRFGDCKDKVQLLRDFLDQMDIVSHPCLVTTYSGGTIAESLPNPLLFNHVILCIELGDRTYFVDPTSSFQGGDLASSGCGDFGFGLFLTETTEALTAIPAPILEKGTVTDVLFLADKDQPEMHIESRLYEQNANFFRYFISNQTQYDIAQNYEQYNRDIFGSIEVLEPLKIEDDPIKNKISVFEKYRLPSFWVSDPEKKTKEGWLIPLSMKNYLGQIIDPNRKTPLRIDHPLRLKETIQIEFDVPKSDIQDQTIDHGAFSFKICGSKTGPTRYKMAYELVTHRNSLEPGELLEYSQKLDEAKRACHLSFTKNEFPEEKSVKEWGFSQSAILIGGIAAIFLIIRKIWLKCQ